MTTARRPSSASATPRGRSPGAMIVQPSRRPAAPAMTIAVSSSRPWGRISPQKLRLLPRGGEQAGRDAEVRAVEDEDVRGR